MGSFFSCICCIYDHGKRSREHGGASGEGGQGVVPPGLHRPPETNGDQTTDASGGGTGATLQRSAGESQKEQQANAVQRKQRILNMLEMCTSSGRA